MIRQLADNNPPKKHWAKALIKFYLFFAVG